jgi:hypothetical protein
MKKQLLIAAVAATMSVSAMADISIAGSAKVNYTTTDFDGTAANTNKFSREMDLKITGKSGDTTIVMNFGDLDNVSDQPDLEDAYVSTSIGDVSIKTGTWDNGNNALRASARGDNKFSASTTMGGVKIAYDVTTETASSKLADTIKLSGDVAGVAVAYKSVDNGEDISLSTTISGVKVSYLALNRDAANTDRSVVEVSGTVAGIGIKVAQADADSSTRISGDTWMGDFEDSTYDGTTSGAYDLSNGQDVTSIELSGSIAGNTVKFRTTDVDGVSGSDMSFNKVIVTRALSNGTTFEATYTDLDDSTAANDASTLDLELSVSF